MSSELMRRSHNGHHLDHFTNTVIRDPEIILGTSTTGGWYRVNVSEVVFPWIMEHGAGMWCWDRSMLRSHNNNHLLVRPKLLTLLKLKWL